MTKTPSATSYNYHPNTTTPTPKPKQLMVAVETSTAEGSASGATTVTTEESRWSRLASPTIAMAETATTTANAGVAAMTRRAINEGSGDLANLATTTEHLAQSTTS